MSWNPYPYAFGNPVNYTDPSGEFPWLVAAAGAMLIGAVAGGMVAGIIDLAIQSVDNVLNGRDPFECIDSNSLVISIMSGAIVGGLLGPLFPMAPWVVGGAFITGTENLSGQIKQAVSEGRTDNFFDALLYEVNWSDVISHGIVGGVASGILGSSGYLGVGGRLGFGGYAASIFIRRIFNDEAVFSSKDAAYNIISGGILNVINSVITSSLFVNLDDAISFTGVALPQVFTFSELPFVFRAIVYGVTGIEVTTIQHLLTDDDPTQNDAEGQALAIGAANAVSALPQPWDDILTFVGNTIVNIVGSATDR